VNKEGCVQALSAYHTGVKPDWAIAVKVAGLPAHSVAQEVAVIIPADGNGYTVTNTGFDVISHPLLFVTFTV
jgi:hypothetical protein